MREPLKYKNYKIYSNLSFHMLTVTRPLTDPYQPLHPIAEPLKYKIYKIHKIHKKYSNFSFHMLTVTRWWVMSCWPVLIPPEYFMFGANGLPMDQTFCSESLQYGFKYRFDHGFTTESVVHTELTRQPRRAPESVEKRGSKERWKFLVISSLSLLRRRW
jgi:hypothetical protein